MLNEWSVMNIFGISNVSRVSLLELSNFRIRMEHVSWIRWRVYTLFFYLRQLRSIFKRFKYANRVQILDLKTDWGFWGSTCKCLYSQFVLSTTMPSWKTSEIVENIRPYLNTDPPFWMVNILNPTHPISILNRKHIQNYLIRKEIWDDNFPFG